MPDALDTVVARFVARSACCTIYQKSGNTVSRSSALWQRAQRVRASLRARGMQRGDVLALVLPSGMDVLAALLGAWADGIAISLLPHELGEQSGHLAPAKFAAMLTLIKPRVVLIADELLCHMPREFHQRVLCLRELNTGCDQLPEIDAPPHAQPQDIAILQFTSGSTGLPKAVVISQAMLSANCMAISDRIEANARDRVVSWLPLNHDMGLSAVTMAWWFGIDLVLLPTAQFGRHPLIWLEAISTMRGTLSPAPATAYSLLARYAASAKKLDLDLSCWRYAWAGAEPVFEKHLHQFVTSMRCLGLGAHVVQPAYGMAEAVVAVSLNLPGQPYEVVWIDALEMTHRHRVIRRAAHASGAVSYVSNGRPLASTEVAIFSDNGKALPPDQAGAVYIRGPSVLSTYLGEPTLRSAEQWFHTGDIGFILEGNVYICGRAKDLITRAGLNIGPHELEWAVEQALDLRAGSVAAFSLLDAHMGRERVVVAVASHPPAAQREEIRIKVAAAIATQVRVQIDEVLFVKRSSLPKTTSGKIQRAQLRQAYQRGDLAEVAIPLIDVAMSSPIDSPSNGPKLESHDV